MMAMPMKTLELHYPMVEFLITYNQHLTYLPMDIANTSNIESILEW